MTAIADHFWHQTALSTPSAAVGIPMFPSDIYQHPWIFTWHRGRHNVNLEPSYWTMCPWEPKSVLELSMIFCVWENKVTRFVLGVYSVQSDGIIMLCEDVKTRRSCFFHTFFICSIRFVLRRLLQPQAWNVEQGQVLYTGIGRYSWDKISSTISNLSYIYTAKLWFIN